MLFDFYETLLTDKQRQYMALYYKEDHSLGEIANEANVSRQAIYDTIKRTEEVIENYEEKLQLYAKFTKRQTLLEKLHDSLLEQTDEAALHIVKQLENMN